MSKISYARHRFPPAIIQHSVWLYYRFAISLRDVEDLLAERGIDVSYETVRRWVHKFGPAYAKRIRLRRPSASGRWHLDEVFVRIGGRVHYLWRAVDDEGAYCVAYHDASLTKSVHGLSTPDQNPATRRSKTTPLTARVFEEVSVFFRLGALFEAVALAVHLQNVDMMGQSIEKRTGEAL